MFFGGFPFFEGNEDDEEQGVSGIINLLNAEVNIIGLFFQEKNPNQKK